MVQSMVRVFFLCFDVQRLQTLQIIQ
uniref:Uncharacterized protein n=1 Tax=uncultured bacterium 59 TaxID=698390 RepID=E3T6G1_9BACT|nr:hypothetical protein [uncultured bacterium 59]